VTFVHLVGFIKKEICERFRAFYYIGMRCQIYVLTLSDSAKNLRYLVGQVSPRTACILLEY